MCTRLLKILPCHWRYCPVSITSVTPLLTTSNNEEGVAAGVLRRGSRCIEQLCCLLTTIQGSLHWAAAERRQHSSFSSDMYNACTCTYYNLTITLHDEIHIHVWTSYISLNYFLQQFLTSVSFTDTDKNIKMSLKYSNEIVWTCIIIPPFHLEGTLQTPYFPTSSQGKQETLWIFFVATHLYRSETSIVTTMW